MKTHLSTLQALREALPILWSQIDRTVRNHLAWSFALMIGTSIVSAALPLIFTALIDHFNPDRTPAPDARTLVILVLGYVVSMYLVAAVGEQRTYIHNVAIQRLQRLMSARLLIHVLHLPLHLHLNRQSGSVGHILARGLAGFQTLLQHVLFTIIPVVIELGTIVAILLGLNRLDYLGIFMVSAALYLAAFVYGAMRVAKPAQDAMMAYIAAHGTLSDSLINYETVKHFTREAEMARQYNEDLELSEHQYRKLFNARRWNGQLIALITLLSQGTTLMYAGYGVLGGALTVGGFILMQTYATRLSAPLQTLGTAMRDLSEATANFKEMQQILREKPELDTAVDGGPIEVHGELKFENVTFGYTPDKPLLRGVTFTVQPGKKLAIVGLSGSGKSTIVRLLFRLYALDGGRITLDGVPITNISLRRLREKIGVVAQDTVLFYRSMRHNIAFGRPNASQEEIEEAARLASLHQFLPVLRDPDAPKVGERGIKLSGGERQRVAIARAVIKRPCIYVFDEATSSLDVKTERQISQDLDKVSKGRTTVVIAHRISTVMNADQIVVLHEGVIVEQGTPDELLALRGRFAELWNTQQTASVSAPTPETSVA